MNKEEFAIKVRETEEAVKRALRERKIRKKLGIRKKYGRYSFPPDVNIEETPHWRKRFSVSVHSKCRNKLKEEVEKEGINTITSGWPDCLLVKENKIVAAVEIKTGKDKLSGNQKKIKELFSSAGIPYFVYRGEENFLEKLEV